MGYPDLTSTVQAGWEALIEVEAELEEAKMIRNHYAEDFAHLPIAHLNGYLHNAINRDLPIKQHLRVRNAEYHGSGYVFTLNKSPVKKDSNLGKHLQHIFDHYVKTFDWATWIHSPFENEKPLVKTPTEF